MTEMTFSTVAPAMMCSTAERGRDRLISGAGRDTINGGEGSDSYVITRSTSLKEISDFDSDLSNLDVVSFRNLRSSDVRSVRQEGLGLLIDFTTNDQILVSNYFVSRDFRIEEFRFSDGVTWNEANVMGLIPPA